MTTVASTAACAPKPVFSAGCHPARGLLGHLVMRTRTRSLVFLPLLGLACDSQPPGTVQAPFAAATYRIDSSVALGASAALPSRARESLQALSSLRENPARTFFDLLEQAGVPAVEDLRDALPDVIEAKIEGWINAYVAGARVGEAPVTALLEETSEDILAFLLNFELVSRLELPATDDAGNARGQHVCEAVVFVVDDQRIEVPVPSSVGVVTGAAVDTHTARGDLVLGDHSFGLPFGQAAIVGVDRLVKLRFGADTLREALGTLIGCDALAASVASRCVGFACVGHAKELAAVCEKGLDQVVEDVHQRLGALDFKAVHFLSGEARRKDLGLQDGTWQLAVDLGQGEAPAQASFIGTTLVE